MAPSRRPVLRSTPAYPKILLFKLFVFISVPSIVTGVADAQLPLNAVSKTQHVAIGRQSKRVLISAKYLTGDIMHKKSVAW